MYKALAIKELRESAGLLAVALLAAAFVLAELTGVRLVPFQSGRYSEYPFVSDAITGYLWVVAGALAVLLGFKQSAWELWQGTYYFLLHRPTSRTAVFGAKLVVGLLALMALVGALIQIYAMWAATTGTHPTPFFWSMTEPAWQVWMSAPLVYLGAFLSGIRPGRWFGSRLVPLVAAGMLAGVAANMPWWWLTLPIVLASAAAFISAILLYVATRDY